MKRTLYYTTSTPTTILMIPPRKEHGVRHALRHEGTHLRIHNIIGIQVKPRSCFQNNLKVMVWNVPLAPNI